MEINTIFAFFIFDQGDFRKRQERTESTAYAKLPKTHNRVVDQKSEDELEMTRS